MPYQSLLKGHANCFLIYIQKAALPATAHVACSARQSRAVRCVHDADLQRQQLCWTLAGSAHHCQTPAQQNSQGQATQKACWAATAPRTLPLHHPLPLWLCSVNPFLYRETTSTSRWLLPLHVHCQVASLRHAAVWEAVATLTMAEEAGVSALRAELYACRRSRDQARAHSELKHLTQPGHALDCWSVCTDYSAKPQNLWILQLAIQVQCWRPALRQRQSVLGPSGYSLDQGCRGQVTV